MLVQRSMHAAVCEAMRRVGRSELENELEHRMPWRLTFDMSGGPKGAERPSERPLDGGVRFHATLCR